MVKSNYTGVGVPYCRKLASGSTASERGVQGMANELMLPVGIESFDEIRNGNFYYIDKTRLIEQLLNQWGKVNLFTRPRRFGKTLNMSMLRYFFEIGTDRSLFDGLYISKNKELCDEYLGKFPVIFISLKDVEGTTFEKANYSLVEIIAKEAKRFSFLLDSDKLTSDEKDHYRAITDKECGQYTMSEMVFPSSLQVLSELLCKHYEQKTIILIDEYDVPLDKAFQNGYYREMVALIRGLLGRALKSNESLQFAVLTGCLRVSKESIFTGLNNFKVLSITDVRFDEQFGFTEDEVKKLLETYHLDSHMAEAKEWYDGYRFGDVDVYCPWDVMNYVDELKHNSNAEPGSYWINSSSNDLVKRFIDKADKTTRDEIELLLAGEAIEKRVRLELTYDEIDSSIDNVWSVLFTTGYLTQTGKPKRDVYMLKIPNEEVREVFKYQIQEWFDKTVQNDTNGLAPFWRALSDGDAKIVEDSLTRILSQTISVLDPKGSEMEKEQFYHAFLSGMLVGNKNWGILSNKESGMGFADLMVETDDPNSGLIIELKSVGKITQLDDACERAMLQIHDRRYDEYLRNEGRNEILAYGIAFYKKRCKVVVEKLKSN